jgi:hypothetical protein
LLAQFGAEKTPDYYAVRTEVMKPSVGEGGVPGYDDATSPWSASQSQEVGAACKTAKDVAGCMSKLAALRELGAGTCTTPAASPPICVFNYIVATRGDDVFPVHYDSDPKAFVDALGTVVTWQEAVTIAQQQVALLGERDCKNTPPVGYRVTPSGWDVITYGALPFLSDCFGWFVVHVNPDATTTKLAMDPDFACEE